MPGTQEGDDIVRPIGNYGLRCLDGFATVEEYAKRMKEINQQFLTITDHGVMGAVPQQIRQCDKHKLFPIFGCEIYVNHMQPRVETRYESAEFRKDLPEALHKKFDKSCHITAIACTNEGYSNLVRLTSWAWIHGFYRRPRVNHEVLQKYKEGIIFLSGCANSEIAQTLFTEGEDAALEMLIKYHSIFGNNFYLETMMIDYEPQKPYNAFLIKAHERFGIPLVVTTDCLVKGTVITTTRGSIYIEDVRVGDMVLTHQNRFKKVEYINVRNVRKKETVYRVKARLGTYAWESTGNHKVRVALVRYNWRVKKKEVVGFDWKRVDQLNTSDYLVVPKFGADLFSKEDLPGLNLFEFINKDSYQRRDKIISNSGNYSTQCVYHPETDKFVSYHRFDKSSTIKVPRVLPLDDELLRIIGLYMAEGSSEKNGTLVGFGLHREEIEERDLIIGYFGKFGIKVYVQNVSDNGISCKFSSRLFNEFFGSLCGYGAVHKHFPNIGNKTFGVLSRRQIKIIISQYLKGDGSQGDNADSVSSVSKLMIFDLASFLSSMGFPVIPYYGRGKNHSNPNANPDNWNDSWHIGLGGSRKISFENLIFDLDEFVPDSKNTAFLDCGESCIAVHVQSVMPIDYNDNVYNLQVEEDESYTANLYQVHNCHYCKREHSHNQRLMLMQQNKRTIQEIQSMIDSGEGDNLYELQDANLWLKSEEEMDQKWETDFHDIYDYELYKQAKSNTVEICRMARGVELDRDIKLPKIPDAERILREEIYQGFTSRHCPKTRQYLDRIKEEYELIREKGFASYFLIQKQMTDEARRIGPEVLGFGDGTEAVGPGRGSVCGSLVAYCLRLHDVEPIIHNLRFSRFLSPARGGKQQKIRHSIEPIPHEEVAL